MALRVVAALLILCCSGAGGSSSSGYAVIVRESVGRRALNAFAVELISGRAKLYEEAPHDALPVSFADVDGPVCGRFWQEQSVFVLFGPNIVLFTAEQGVANKTFRNPLFAAAAHAPVVDSSGAMYGITRTGDSPGQMGVTKCSILTQACGQPTPFQSLPVGFPPWNWTSRCSAAGAGLSATLAVVDFGIGFESVPMSVGNRVDMAAAAQRPAPAPLASLLRASPAALSGRSYSYIDSSTIVSTVYAVNDTWLVRWTVDSLVGVPQFENLTVQVTASAAAHIDAVQCSGSCPPGRRMVPGLPDPWLVIVSHEPSDPPSYTVAVVGLPPSPRQPAHLLGLSKTAASAKIPKAGSETFLMNVIRY